MGPSPPIKYKLTKNIDVDGKAKCEKRFIELLFARSSPVR
jgi:hypothetical protein